MKDTDPAPLHQELDTHRQQGIWDPSSVAWSQIHPVSEWDAPNLRRAVLDVYGSMRYIRLLTHGNKLADVHNNKRVFLHGGMSVLSNNHKWSLCRCLETFIVFSSNEGTSVMIKLFPTGRDKRQHQVTLTLITCFDNSTVMKLHCKL